LSRIFSLELHLSGVSCGFVQGKMNKKEQFYIFFMKAGWCWGHIANMPPMCQKYTVSGSYSSQ
jgi:hypothetical protein